MVIYMHASLYLTLRSLTSYHVLVFFLETTAPAAPPRKGRAMAAAGFRYSDISVTNITR